MKNNKILIYCFTAVLLIFTVLLFLKSSDTDPESLFGLEVHSTNKTEEVKCWLDENEDMYVFLPSYVQLSDAVINLKTESEITINDILLSDGMKCDVFEIDNTYKLTYSDFLKTHNSKITFLKSDNVAAMYVDTQSSSMEYIHRKKGNEESATIRLYNADGELNFDGDINSINGRGNSTWDYYDKKPYSITLSNEADLLSMGSAQKWILLANATDSSNLRNKILYDFSSQIGLKYSPECEWVDLYLNGEYAGLYLLSERNEVHKNRVDITPQDDSFLVSMENSERSAKQSFPYVLTDSNQAFRIHYPISFSDEYLIELKDTLQSVENAIMADDGIDPVTGKLWTQLIDLDSWARKYLIEEISGNWDACAISQYFYYDSSDESGKIYASPVWDYDNTLGNKNSFGAENPNVLYGNKLKVRTGYDAPWFYHLYQKDEFYKKVVELYQSEIAPQFEQSFEEKLYIYAKQIEQADKLNRIRWNFEQENIHAEAEYIDTFMKNRLEFLDEIWIKNTPYHTISLHNNFYLYYIVLDGENAPVLPVLNDTPSQTFLGWYYEETDKPFDMTKPIDSDINLYAKWEERPQETAKDILKIVPVLFFAVIFLGLLLIELKRNKKG